MQKQQFTLELNASKEKVWDVLWNIDSYRSWTAAFSEGSTVQTDNWKKGTKVIFGDGKGSGMLAEIADNIPNEFMSFRHIGEVKDGVEDTTSDKVKEWAGALENYTLKEVDGKTLLTVEMDINDQWLNYFMETWPKALANIKQLAEQ